MEAERASQDEARDDDTPHREFDLQGRGRVVVRAVRPADAGALGDLYQGLTLDDRYHRFFSVYYPSADFLDHLARTCEEGGYGLVAVLDDGRIVGEASYTLLRNGDGEFAIVVASDWRGWLSPYLLDALAQSAAARGVPNLEADILLENTPMLALVRARGFVTLDHVGPVVRVAIGTTGRMPVWPRHHDRRRVLVEASGARWRAEEAVRDAGFQVAVCPGPGPRCPALRGEPCPLAADADAIVLALDLQDPRARALVRAHRSCHPAVPLCVETPARGTPVPLPAGVVHVDRGSSDADLVAALEDVTGPAPSDCET